MAGYLDTYGVKEMKRERIVKRILLSLLTVLVVGGTLYFLFRNYREESKVREFLALLEKKEYRGAYAMFGCTEATPCRDYRYERFLEDWGPQSPAANAAAITREKVKSCDGGIIQFLKVRDQEVMLFVDRTNRLIGYSPWPVCAPRVRL